MSKDPAFLFYTGDFIAGIQDLTFEERGQYITLLCLQHQKGHLSDKLIKLSVGNATADVMAKFRQDSAGLWFNHRLDEEIAKRKAHGEKQRERALEGWKKRKTEATSSKSSSTGNAVALPLEDETIIRIEDENLNEYKKWTDQILDNNDAQFETLLFNERWVIDIKLFDHLVRDHLGLLHRYPNMRPKGQQSFRQSLLKHIRENKDKSNGKGTSNKQQHTDSIKDTIRNTYGYTGK